MSFSLFIESVRAKKGTSRSFKSQFQHFPIEMGLSIVHFYEVHC